MRITIQQAAQFNCINVDKRTEKKYTQLHFAHMAIEALNNQIKLNRLHLRLALTTTPSIKIYM